MAESQRDSTEDWLPPVAARPPTVAELERRIDVALAVARASEAAALEIGAAALDAAEQARRAAELAERASSRIAGNGVATAGREPAAEAEHEEAPANGDLALINFTERADRVVARLRAVGQPQ
ncbi:MAG: hypothetical protein ACOYD4_03795 [Solirubrobacterales bacterium]